MRTVPVNQSDCPLPDGCEPTLLISILCTPFFKFGAKFTPYWRGRRTRCCSTCCDIGGDWGSQAHGRPLVNRWQCASIWALVVWHSVLFLPSDFCPLLPAR